MQALENTHILLSHDCMLTISLEVLPHQELFGTDILKFVKGLEQSRFTICPGVKMHESIGCLMLTLF